jgi:PTH1 family peptidyl-tRNA hydrolase
VAANSFQGAGGPLKLLVGLGNPGSKYAATRHNAGYWFADAVAARFAATFRGSPKFFGELAEISIGGQSLRVLKPTTYMNQSGRSVSAVVQFFRLAVEDILIAHDEIDLPPGVVRLKRGGGHGGHNGLRDVIPALGSPDFARLRFGVGHPGHKDLVTGYVLNRPGSEEQALIESAVADALDVFKLIAQGEFQRAMSSLHRKPDASGGDANADDAG